jgi:hypothetical protein
MKISGFPKISIVEQARWRCRWWTGRWGHHHRRCWRT